MSDSPEFDALDLAAAAARGVFNARGQIVIDMHEEIDRLMAEITRLQAIIDAGPVVDPPPPPPPSGKTLIGISGKSDLPGLCERWFSPGGLTNAAPRRPKASCPRVHASWKVLGTTWSDALLIAAFHNLLDGDKVEVEHETDAKWRKDGNDGNLASRLAAKNKFYDDVKRLRDTGKIVKVDVVNTMTSYAFQPSQIKITSPTKYDAKADVLGADLDGDDSSSGGYMNYGDPVRLQNIVDHAKAHYGGRWTAPEHGWDNTVPGERMAHFRTTIPAIAKFGPEEIQVFDSSGFSPVLTTAELAELSAIAKNYNV